MNFRVQGLGWRRLGCVGGRGRRRGTILQGKKYFLLHDSHNSRFSTYERISIRYADAESIHNAFSYMREWDD